MAPARGIWHTSCQLSSSSGKAAPSLTEGAKKGKNPRRGSRWLGPIHNTRVANQPLRTLRMLEGWILRGKEDLQPELNVPGRQNPRCLLQLPRPRLCPHVFLSGMRCSFPRLMFPSFWSSPPWEPGFPVTMSSPFFQFTRCQGSTRLILFQMFVILLSSHYITIPLVPPNKSENAKMRFHYLWGGDTVPRPGV